MMSTVAADEAERRLHYYGSNPRNKVREGRQVTIKNGEGRGRMLLEGFGSWVVGLACEPVMLKICKRLSCIALVAPKY